jgi:CBS domain-containing protein
MTPEYLRGAYFENYGVSLFVGVGIPIPILNEKIAQKTSIKDEDIITEVVDYGIPIRDKPILKKTNYNELKSGFIELKGKKIKCSSMSSLYYARRIANELKNWILNGKFFLNPPAESLSTQRIFKPMKLESELKFVKDLKRKAVICYEDCDISVVAQKIIESELNHILITDKEKKLKGIVTSFDIAKTIAQNHTTLNEIITKKIVTTKDNEPVSFAIRKMKKNNISALPVINNDYKVVGIITSEDII